MTADIDPAVLTATRESLHRVAEHLLAATLKRATGKIALQPGPGGLWTPQLPDGTRLGIDGAELVVSRPAAERREPLTTLAQAAAFAGVPAGFPWTKHPPATPFEPDAPLTVDPAAAAALAGWFQLGQQALKALSGELTAETPSKPTLWPEHFDLAITVGAVNFGFSPGDAAIATPYVYVGPHELPAVGEFWNAPFGAYRTWDDVGDAPAALAFLRSGHDAAHGRR
jgi:hypothetical protein